MGPLASTLSVALGGRIIEKNFTLDKNLPGPDHKASVILEFAELVDSIRATELALGDSSKRRQPEKLKWRCLKKSIVLNVDLKKGEEITLEHITLSRPGTGLYAKEIKYFGPKLYMIYLRAIC